MGMFEEIAADEVVLVADAGAHLARGVEEGAGIFEAAEAEREDARLDRDEAGPLQAAEDRLGDGAAGIV
jgi:hypothetical protein